MGNKYWEEMKRRENILNEHLPNKKSMSQREQIEQKVKAILEEANAVEDAKMNDNLYTDLGLDSLDVLELCMECENAFGVTIPDQQISDFTTVGSIVTFIDEATPPVLPIQ
jgi:acyl carrier protein